MQSPIHDQLANRPSRRRGWIWFFVILLVLTGAAVSVQVWYGWKQQLTPEQLAAAQALWKQSGPADYDLRYTIKRQHDSETYQVQVRRGQAVAAQRNGAPVEARLLRYQTMPALFGFIEEFIRQDQGESTGVKRGVFVRADFDPADGHLLRYIRSVRGTGERVEIDVEQLQPMPAGRGT